MTISLETARRFILGRQGLWPGRRWRGIDGATEAIRYAGSIQIDPLCVVARSHDIALWGRVAEYAPDHLDHLLHRERACFDYGGCLFIYPIEELPYWRVPMRRRAANGRWKDWACKNAGLIDEVREALRERGPLGNRDFTNRPKATVNTYRGRKDTGPALYYLWITGELMTHSRVNFQRRYAFREHVAPAHVDYEATEEEAEHFFARKAVQGLGLAREVAWTGSFSSAIHRRVDRKEGRPRLESMLENGDLAEVRIDGWKDPHYALADDLPLIESIAGGRVPDSWQPVETSTGEEVVFLAPLDMVSARGRAKKLFGFDYVWEVYKPAHLRRWGYYTLPILYGDRLVGRIDPRLDRKSKTLVINGVWLEDQARARDDRFVGAFNKGLDRFRQFLDADRIACAESASCDLPIPVSL